MCQAFLRSSIGRGVCWSGDAPYSREPTGGNRDRICWQRVQADWPKAGGPRLQRCRPYWPVFHGKASQKLQFPNSWTVSGTCICYHPSRVRLQQHKHNEDPISFLPISSIFSDFSHFKIPQPDASLRGELTHLVLVIRGQCQLLPTRGTMVRLSNSPTSCEFPADRNSMT